MKTALIIMMGIAAIALAFSGIARSADRIDWQAISGGGADAASANFHMSGTAGQTATGLTTSGNFKVAHGFWLGSGVTTCCVNPGDANSDASVNLGDAVYLINYIFRQARHRIV